MWWNSSWQLRLKRLLTGPDTSTLEILTIYMYIPQNEVCNYVFVIIPVWCRPKDISFVTRNTVSWVAHPRLVFVIIVLPWAAFFRLFFFYLILVNLTRAHSAWHEIRSWFLNRYTSFGSTFALNFHRYAYIDHVHWPWWKSLNLGRHENKMIRSKHRTRHPQKAIC